MSSLLKKREAKNYWREGGWSCYHLKEEDGGRSQRAETQVGGDPEELSGREGVKNPCGNGFGLV